MSWLKDLDVDPKSIQQIEFVGQLTNTDGINANVAEFIFILTILEKSKKQDSNFLKEV